MGRHTHVKDMDYFEVRAEEMARAQRKRYAIDPPKDDDLTRHLKELEVTDLIAQYRLISGTYQK